MAVKREDGRIRILGRVEDVINLGGQKIAIEPFENAVRKTLGIDSLCVFAQQDMSGKDMLVVAIEGTEPAGQAQRGVLASRLPQFKTIRYSLIDRFPRGKNGMMKVNRRKLLELVRASWEN
jgi:acyl-coenzyme A synthetase/AMP-(fatty) acid ligase